MISSTSRSRLYELRRDRIAAERGAELLERKREVLVRETAERAARVGALTREAHASYSSARELLRVAEVGLGAAAVSAAALAQPLTCLMESRPVAVMGVPFDEIRATSPPFRAVYGAAATNADLDAAGIAFTQSLTRFVNLAAEQNALARLRVAVRKATKIVNALQKIILPHLIEQIRLILNAIAEEERDEAIRRKMRLASR